MQLTKNHHLISLITQNIVLLESLSSARLAVVRCLSTLHGTRLEVLDSAIDMWCGLTASAIVAQSPALH